MQFNEPDVLGIGGGAGISSADFLESFLWPVSAALVSVVLLVVVRRARGSANRISSTEVLFFGGAVGATIYALRESSFVSWVNAAALAFLLLVSVTSRRRSAQAQRRLDDELQQRKAILAAEDARSLESLQAELRAVRQELERERATAPVLSERIRAAQALHAAKAELRDLRSARRIGERRAKLGARSTGRNAPSAQSPFDGGP
jgi:hypothetical protein